VGAVENSGEGVAVAKEVAMYIKSIVPVQTGAIHRFTVTFTDSTQATVTAAELQSYPRFQRAILAQTGQLFYYTNAEYRGGVSAWRVHVSLRLRESPQPQMAEHARPEKRAQRK